MCSSVFVLIALACISASTLAFNVQLSPRLGIPLSRKATAVRKGNNLASTGVSLMKLGAGLQRDEEEEYFESDFDRKPLKERLPVALGFLGAVSLPFIIGLIYLYSNK